MQNLKLYHISCGHTIAEKCPPLLNKSMIVTFSLVSLAEMGRVQFHSLSVDSFSSFTCLQLPFLLYDELGPFVVNCTACVTVRAHQQERLPNTGSNIIVVESQAGASL